MNIGNRNVEPKGTKEIKKGLRILILTNICKRGIEEWKTERTREKRKTEINKLINESKTEEITQ